MLFLLLLLFTLASASPQTHSLPPTHLPELIKLTKPAVTTIHVYNDYGEVVNQGSGFFLRPNLLVSARHLFWKEFTRNASYAKAITNSYEKLEFHIRTVISDEIDSDLILLGTEPFDPEDINPFPCLTLSPEDVEEGEAIYVISSPLGLPGIISTGIVSAIHNEFDMQIGAAISQGSSGGPIFNLNGQVVGIVSGHFQQGQNINFGISIYALNMLIQKAQTDKTLSNEIRPVLVTQQSPHLYENTLPTLQDWIRFQNQNFPHERPTVQTTNEAGVINGILAFFSNAWESTTKILIKNQHQISSQGFHHHPPLPFGKSDTGRDNDTNSDKPPRVVIPPTQHDNSPPPMHEET